MTPDELWEKYKYESPHYKQGIIDGPQFLAALREYGEAVRKRDAEICNKKALKARMPTMVSAFHDCAAAIENMEMP